MAFQKRAEIVKQFCEGTEYRVLIISNVGSTGLNLSVASVMILLVSNELSKRRELAHVLTGPVVERPR